MTGRRGRVRVVLLTVAPLACLWAGLWAALASAGWHARPLGLLAALVLAAALARLVGALASMATELPRVDVRAPRRSPVGEDQRLLRHQLHLEDATGDPPSCRPILTRISELARERARLVDGHDLTAGSPTGPAARQLLGDRLSALLDERPPDRTRLSPGELARLVDDLEAVGRRLDPQL